MVFYSSSRLHSLINIFPNLSGGRRDLDLRERTSDQVGGRHPEVQGPSEIQDPERERCQCGQSAQIVPAPSPPSATKLTRTATLFTPQTQNWAYY